MQECNVSGGEDLSDGTGLAVKTTARRILDGACSAFLELGFEGASMDEIARRAKVSKPTLYSHFADKRAVFATFVRRECAAQAAGIFPVDVATPDIAAALQTIGERLLELVLTPFALGVFRVVVSEAPRFPELGRAFYSSTIDLSVRRLSMLLAAAVGRAELEIDDIELAAHQFLDMCRSDLAHRRLFDPAADATASQRRRTVEAAVGTFMRAYRPQPRTARPKAQAARR